MQKEESSTLGERDRRMKNSPAEHTDDREKKKIWKRFNGPFPGQPPPPPSGSTS